MFISCQNAAVRCFDRHHPCPLMSRARTVILGSTVMQQSNNCARMPLLRTWKQAQTKHRLIQGVVFTIQWPTKRLPVQASRVPLLPNMSKHQQHSCHLHPHHAHHPICVTPYTYKHNLSSSCCLLSHGSSLSTVGDTVTHRP